MASVSKRKSILEGKSEVSLFLLITDEMLRNKDISLWEGKPGPETGTQLQKSRI